MPVPMQNLENSFRGLTFFSAVSRYC